MTDSQSDNGVPAPVRRMINLVVLSQAAAFFILVYGLVLALTSYPNWALAHDPTSVIGPESFVQWWTVQFDNALYLLGFGVVLAAGAAILSRRLLARGRDRVVPRSEVSTILLVVAIGSILGAGIAIALPTPQRTVSFAASDFTIEPLPGNVPFENYFVSVPFQAYAGESLFPMMNLTLRDNATGALDYWEDFAYAWYTTPSAVLDWHNRSTSGFGAVVPQDGLYILWVRYEFCETLGTMPCSNYTGSVQGQLVISNRMAYEPWILGLGLLGSASVVAAVVQSGMGRRRTTS